MTADYRESVLHAPMCGRCWLGFEEEPETAPSGLVDLVDDDEVKRPCEWCGQMTVYSAVIEVDLGRGML